MNSSPSARLRPFRPQPFGRYTLLSHLATGGMGDIYLARLEGMQGFEKLCVIKKILPQLAEDAEFVERFVGEARTLVKLSHGSIAQVLDMGLHEGEAYMALEYVDGKDLRKVAARGRDRQMPLPLTYTLYVTSRVLDALAYAHRKRDDDEKELNLVHRDISPQNILISYEGEVKVIDFGLAKSRLSAAKTNPSIILGKFLYMSPEQARHQPVDRRSDLYAVGLCLYELLAGKNPFDALPPGELMSAVANPRIAPIHELEPLVPPNVAQVVMKALAVDPAERYQSAEEFRGRLLACLLEIDPLSGPESVSRFMCDVFSAEYQHERKLLAGLREVPRQGASAPEASRTSTAVSMPEVTAGAAKPLPPTLPPKTIVLDGPVQPLSFHPTPRSRDGGPARDDGETRPGVVVDEPTRPGVPIEALDATARARLRPSTAEGPSSPSPTVEVRMDGLATPVPESRASALTLEMPAMDAAALAQSPASTGLGPSVPWEQEEPRPVATFAPTPKPAEPPRAAPPVAAPEAPREPEPAVAEPARASEVTRPDAPVPAARPPSLPSLPAAPAPRPSVPAMPAAVPAPARVPEAFRPTVATPTVQPRAPEAVAPVPAPAPARVPEAFRPTVAAPTVQPRAPEPAAPAPPPQARMPEPRPAPRAPEFNAAEVARSYAATIQIPTVSGSGGPVEPQDGEAQNELPILDSGVLELPAAPQGLEDTQPRYARSAGNARHEDTLPRVVLEDAELQSLRRDEEISSGGVGSGTREATPATGRSKTPRRPRPPVPDASPAQRAQSTADTSPSARALAARSNPPESVPDLADAHEDAPEPHEEEAASDAARSARERMLLYASLGALVLLVAVAVVLVGLPALRARGARPVPAHVESGPPTPEHAAPASSGAGARAAGETAPTDPTAGNTVPAAGSEATEVVAAAGTAPQKQTPPAPAPSVEDELLAPLEAPPVAQAPVAPVRKPSVKPAKRAEPARVKQVRKPLTALQQEWRETRKTYTALTRMTSCDSASISILCDKYLDLEGDVLRAGDEEDAALLGKVKRMNEALTRKLNVAKASQ